MSTEGDPPELTEEQMRQLDAELERIHVDDVVMQTIVSLINLGARKGAVGAPPEAGLTPDNEQLRIAIEAARALLAIVEPRHADKLGPFRDALSQLQLHYARVAAPTHPGPGGQTPPAGEPQQDPEPQPGTQSSGRLWVPGQ
ncbi:MAG: hypothetical protein QOI80_2704 [Solirubrobacteraceae bacterium]|jgi:hypothetical protein|nr:hypothetical protein [Solirubrobacteraceae bacterium]